MAERPLDAEQPSKDPRTICRELLKAAHASVKEKGESLFITPLRPGSNEDEVAVLQAVLVLLDLLEPFPAFEIGTFDKPTLRALSSLQYQNVDKQPNLEAEIGTLGENTLAFLNTLAKQLMMPTKETIPTPRENKADLEYLEKLIGVGTTALRRMVETASDSPSNESIRTHLFLVALVILGEMRVEYLLPCLRPMTYRSESKLNKWYFYFTAHSRHFLEDFQHQYAPQVRTENFGIRVCDETWKAMQNELAQRMGWCQQPQRPATENPRSSVAHTITDNLRRGWQELQSEQARLRWKVSRRMALGTLGGVALGIAGTAGAGWYFREPIRHALWEEEEEGNFGFDDSRNTDDLMQRRVDRLELPDDLTDTEVLLWAAAPVWDGKRGVSYDTMLSRYALSRHLFDGKLLLLDKHDSIQYGGESQRAYDFTIPDELHGEILDYGAGAHALSDTTLADVLNLITRAPTASDQEVKNFLVWWYAKIFENNVGDPIELEPHQIQIKRHQDGKIESVFYLGSHQGDSIYVKQKIRRSDVPGTSAQPGFYSQPTLKPLTGSNGRLLLWTGFEQPLTVPASFLAQHGDAKFQFNGWTVPFAWDELARSVRRYFEVRDQGSKITYTDYKGDSNTITGWAHFVDDQDPVIRRLVEAVTRGLTGYARLEALRRFGQSVEYQFEAGVEVNRPALATLLQSYQQSGGDCNNRSVALSTLFKAAGYRTALVYATNDPGKDKSTEASAHLLVAVHWDEFSDLPETERPADYTVGTERWVVVETGSPESCTFGNSGCIPHGHAVRYIEEVR